MQLYEAFMSSFDKLPIAALVSTPSDKFFCVHGGLSPDITTVPQRDICMRSTRTPGAFARSCRKYRLSTGAKSHRRTAASGKCQCAWPRGALPNRRYFALPNRRHCARSDLLWSDPDPTSEQKKKDDDSASDNGSADEDSDEGWFTENTVRGCSYLYGCVRARDAHAHACRARHGIVCAQH